MHDVTQPSRPYCEVGTVIMPALEMGMLRLGKQATRLKSHSCHLVMQMGLGYR